MNLKFSLEEMKEVLNKALLETNIYSNAITNLDNNISKLGNYWVSSETLTYEEFMDKYLEKKQQLTDAKEYMESFCQRLEDVIIQYEEASKNIKNSFE